MTDVPINQKEYLKKYLGIGKAPGEKKKKKKKPATTSRVQIIDDDADANIPFVTIEDENADEYAPQVVAIIDERPLALRFNDVTNEPLWQPIGTVENTGPNEQKQMISSFKIAPKVSEKVLKSDKSPQRKKRHSPPQNSNSNSMSPVRNVVIKEERKSECRFDDRSPPRKTRSENDYSPLRRIKQEVESPPRGNIEDDTLSRNAENEDYSPPRRRKKRENSPPRRSRWDDDSSVSRSHTNEDILPSKENTDGDSSPPRRSRKDDDISPPRKSKKGDYSPPRRSRKEEDISPPRRNRKNDFFPPRGSIKAKESSPPRRHRRDGSPSIKSKREVGNPSPKRNRRENNSPPRRSKKENENSPPRRNRNEDSFSPPRRNKKTDNSPPRKRKEYIEENTNDSSVRSRTPDKSPPRRPRSGGSGREEKGSNRMEKTLDGKSAGLQNARELIEETRNFKKREDSLFKNLSKDVSGQSAETVHRDRRTGHIRNLEEEEERKRKKREEEEKNKEKYERWGRGLAQVESREQKLQEQLHEMSKPLARYADDEDLERYLKEQEREGDPMLAYIRKKKKKKMAEAGVEIKPQFEGEFMPNRYGIRPGHRWDGVDRSNGYEKKWFEIQNQKRAIQEDSYKWSTEDM